MAMTTAKDLRDMSDRELAEHIASARKDLFGLRFQHATGELENTAVLPAGKRELARALTIAAERRHLAQTHATETES
jgi:large subunit ribosomal protein L29